VRQFSLTGSGIGKPLLESKLVLSAYLPKKK